MISWSSTPAAVAVAAIAAQTMTQFGLRARLSRCACAAPHWLRDNRGLAACRHFLVRGFAIQPAAEFLDGIEVPVQDLLRHVPGDLLEPAHLIDVPL